MQIACVGLWHLGTVMSAVFAAAGHRVVAFDASDVVARLDAGAFPVAEPGLPELAAEQRAAGRLVYSANLDDLRGCAAAWMTYDTPVADDGTADVAFVTDAIAATFSALDRGALVVVCSQLPAGSVAELERRAARAGRADLRFAASPENLRLGRSIEYLQNVDRFVAGVRDDAAANDVRAMLAPLTTNVEIMRVESAEMTKHAINGFLATSVTFINELAGLCELNGADAREVERGLKTDLRIGPKSYLRAGGPYAGGTLARDVEFLIAAQRERGLEPRLLSGVRDANDYHRGWLERRFTGEAGAPAGKRVALLGLTYKSGTDTLRASSALAFARWAVAAGATCAGFDPAISASRPELAGLVTVAASAEEALEAADAAVVSTDWPEFRTLAAGLFADRMREPLILDPNRFLNPAVENDARVRYVAIGTGERAHAAV